MIPIIATLVVLAIGYWLLFVRAKSRHSKMLIARDGVTLDSFVQEFANTPYTRAALEAAYADLSKISLLPIRRADELEKTLGLLPEDFDDMLEKRCRSLGLVDLRQSQHTALFPLKTAEDYVRFLSAVMDEQAKTIDRK